MILDETAEFADAVALNTGGAGTYNVGDIMDLGSARNIGAAGLLSFVSRSILLPLLAALQQGSSNWCQIAPAQSQRMVLKRSTPLPTPSRKRL